MVSVVIKKQYIVGVMYQYKKESLACQRGIP